MRICRLRRLYDLIDICIRFPKQYIPRYSCREERGLLINQTHLFPQPFQAQTLNIMSIEHYLTRIRVIESLHQRDHRALPRSARPDNRNSLTCTDREAQIFEDRARASWVRERDVAEFDLACHFRKH